MNLPIIICISLNTLILISILHKFRIQSLEQHLELLKKLEELKK